MKIKPYFSRVKTIAAVVLLSNLLLSNQLHAQNDPKALYLDYTKPVDARVKDLISRMTLEEKASFLDHEGPDITRFDIKSDK
jgi:beta-glucosidase